MSKHSDPFKTIPGTTVFDGDQARKGYALNMFCMSLQSAANRERFKAAPEAYLQSFGMTAEQRQAVLDRDYGRLTELGGNVYFLGKLSGTDRVPFGTMVASMSGLTQVEYQAMMDSGGRMPEGPHG